MSVEVRCSEATVLRVPLSLWRVSAVSDHEKHEQTRKSAVKRGGSDRTNISCLSCFSWFHKTAPGARSPYGASFEKMIVPEAPNMPPTPWLTLIFAPGTWAGAVPRICRTLSCRAYMPYIPECM